MPKTITPLTISLLGRTLPVRLSVAQAAGLLGVSEATAYRRIHAGAVGWEVVNEPHQGWEVLTIPLLERYGLTYEIECGNRAAASEQG